ncbi:MAG: hypothetical protein PHU12_01845 [Candidatus Aenigmarchaeota archaeon]|nr:hypothetical protein [Candidatus Aenigmarchaeota archaeon]
MVEFRCSQSLYNALNIKPKKRYTDRKITRTLIRELLRGPKNILLGPIIPNGHSYDEIGIGIATKQPFSGKITANKRSARKLLESDITEIDVKIIYEEELREERVSCGIETMHDSFSLYFPLTNRYLARVNKWCYGNGSNDVIMNVLDKPILNEYENIINDRQYRNQPCSFSHVIETKRALARM